MKFSTINPATEQVLLEYKEHTPSDIENKINGSDKIFRSWSNSSIHDKKKLLHQLANKLHLMKNELAILMANEMGKPITQGIAEIEKCAWLCNYCADEAFHMLQPEHIASDRFKSYITYNPIGVLLAIMPWNFPFWQVFRFAVPNVIAGNSIILKHAPNVSGCALEIEKLFVEAGFPENLVTSILVSPEAVPSTVEKILGHKLIKGATLTGSGRAGSWLASTAGKQLKKTVLELGGSDAYIILNDADLQRTAESCAISRMSNGGQTCIAAKRFIVDSKIADDFIGLFKARCEEFVPADPQKSSTNMGPLARNDIRNNLQRQVDILISEKAIKVTGGRIPEKTGYYYPPTIFTNVAKDSVSYSEELFGPVACITTFNTEDEAIELANSTNFGLGAAIFTSDIEKGEYIAANKLEAGSCFVNEFVKSDPRLPFGGIKESGYGRELTKLGVHEFMNIKTVAIQK